MSGRYRGSGWHLGVERVIGVDLEPDRLDRVISGVYGGELDPMPIMEMFDRLESLATHRLPLEQAPRAYEMFQKKTDGCFKVVPKP